MTLNEAMQLITPADHEWAKQLYNENAGTWAARWAAGVPHYLADAAAVAAALETDFIANTPAP